MLITFLRLQNSYIIETKKVNKDDIIHNCQSFLKKKNVKKKESLKQRE